MNHLPVQVVADSIKANADGESHVSVDTPDPARDDAGPLVTWMFAIVFCCSTCVIAATLGACKCQRLLVYWGHEASHLVREYLQKMSVYNILILAILYSVYRLVYFNNSANQPNIRECLYFGEHKLICLALIIGSLIAGLIRYLAVGIAHSETYTFAGKKYDNQLTGHIHSGFSANKSNSFKLVIGPYVLLFVAVSIVTLIFLYAPLPESYTDFVLKQPLCLPGWPQPEDGTFDKRRLLSIAMLMFLPVITILSIEHCCHLKNHGFYTKVPGYYSILNAPFVMVALTTTWTMWLGTLVVVVYTFGLGGGEIFSLWTLFYTCLDSMWLLFLGVTTGLQNSAHG